MSFRPPWRLLALLAGVGLITWMIGELGPTRVARELFAVGPGFLLMPALGLLGLAVRGFGMSALLDPADRPSPGATVASRLASFSLNQTVPALGFAGEPVRLLWLKPESRQAGVAVLILDRALLIIADAAFIVIAAVVAIGSLAMPDRLAAGTVLAIATALAIAAGLIWLTLRHGIAGPALSALALLRIKAAATRVDRARAVDAKVRGLWRENPRRLASSFGFQFASRLLLAAEIWVGLELLGLRVGVLGAMVIASVPLATSVLFTFVPSQLGVQEAAMALVFEALGLPGQMGILVSLLQRLSLLVTLAVGFVLLALAPRTGRAVVARDGTERADDRARA